MEMELFSLEYDENSTSSSRYSSVAHPHRWLLETWHRQKQIKGFRGHESCVLQTARCKSTVSSSDNHSAPRVGEICVVLQLGRIYPKNLPDQ